MNKALSQLIVDNYYEFIFPILKKDFVLEKTINVELEDGEKVQNMLYGADGVLAGSKFSILACDISCEDGVHEWISIFKLNDLSHYILDSAPRDKRIFTFHSNQWIEISPLLQAKFLAGMEFLKENIIEYKKSSKYDELYQALISYLNYEEASH